MSKDSNVQHLNAQDEYFLDTDTPTAPTHIGGLEIYELPKGAGRDFMQKLYAYIKKSPGAGRAFQLPCSTPSSPRSRRAAMRSAGCARPRPEEEAQAGAHVEEARPRQPVEEHIYLHALPRPGGQRELGELVARLHVNRLDRSRPLWEVHLIEGLEGRRFARLQQAAPLAVRRQARHVAVASTCARPTEGARTCRRCGRSKLPKHTRPRPRLRRQPAAAKEATGSRSWPPGARRCARWPRPAATSRAGRDRAVLGAGLDPERPADRAPTPRHGVAVDPAHEGAGCCGGGRRHGQRGSARRVRRGAAPLPARTATRCPRSR
jgi:hypothetical protein